MGGMVDFLTAEIPDIEAVFFVIRRKVPGFNVDALGGGLAGIFVMDQPLHQAGLAHLGLTHQDQLGLVEEFLWSIALHFQDVANDGSGILVEKLGWELFRQGGTMDVQALKVGEFGHRGRERFNAGKAEIQIGQIFQIGDPVRKRAKPFRKAQG